MPAAPFQPRIDEYLQLVQSKGLKRAVLNCKNNRVSHCTGRCLVMEGRTGGHKGNVSAESASPFTPSHCRAKDPSQPGVWPIARTRSWPLVKSDVDTVRQKGCCWFDLWVVKGTILAAVRHNALKEKKVSPMHPLPEPPLWMSVVFGPGDCFKLSSCDETPTLQNKTFFSLVTWWFFRGRSN